MKCPVCGASMELKGTKTWGSYKVLHVEREYKCPNSCEITRHYAPRGSFKGREW